MTPVTRTRPALTLEPLESRDTPATFTVTTTADSGAGSLREAITRANATPAADTILFALPTADPGFVDADNDHGFDPGDYWSIAPASPLPAVTRTVTLDGRSQPGATSSRPVVELNGAGTGASADGLTLANHTRSVVRGLVINRFGGNGLVITGGGRHRVVGNFIGTDAGGTQDRGNKNAGVAVTGSTFNVVGGSGNGNLISGNDVQGVRLGVGADHNTLAGNLVGTTVTGDAALTNGSELYLGDGVRVEGGNFNVIGGRSRQDRNVLSGNFDDGVDVRDGATGNVIRGNYIGTAADGRSPLRNAADGVYLQDAVGTLVGGLSSGDANVIAWNGYNGVFLYGDSHGNDIAGNFIGTNPGGEQTGNGTVAAFADGVFFAQFGAAVGPSGNTVRRNTIAYNADSAIAVDVDPSAATVGNTFSANAVFGNGGVAIDLGSDGATPNDPLDADAGPNRFQNFPVLAPTTGPVYGVRVVSGTLESTPNRTFRIEFFAGLPGGPGGVPLGSVVVGTNQSGQSRQFQFRYKAVPGRPFITATATDLVTGDTSEFSAAVE